jgi:hypothetical protein
MNNNSSGKKPMHQKKQNFNNTIILFFDLDCVDSKGNFLPPKLQDLFEEANNNTNVRWVSEGEIGVREND